ncbi:MAG: hypothetical protein AAGG81_04385, partial [Chlamydiota bacterium]
RPTARSEDCFADRRGSWRSSSLCPRQGKTFFSAESSELKISENGAVDPELSPNQNLLLLLLLLFALLLVMLSAFASFSFASISLLFEPLSLISAFAIAIE